MVLKQAVLRLASVRVLKDSVELPKILHGEAIWEVEQLRQVRPTLHPREVEMTQSPYHRDSAAPSGLRKEQDTQGYQA